MRIQNSDKLLQYADRAWLTLGLGAPADLRLICERRKIILRKELMENDICALYVVTPEGRKVISYNSGLGIQRQRFSVAHEIGHDLLLPKRPDPGLVCKLRVANNAGDIEERRCDAFAGALLAPHWLTRRWFHELASNPENRVAIMANRFNISFSAMRVRLRELGLEASSNNRFRRYRVYRLTA